MVDVNYFVVVVVVVVALPSLTRFHIHRQRHTLNPDLLYVSVNLLSSTATISSVDSEFDIGNLRRCTFPLNFLFFKKFICLFHFFTILYHFVK